MLVIKVGGSLYNLPDLGPRLRAWLGRLPDRRLLLVPGGGASADVVRSLDHTHGLGEEAAHWLALRALTLNAWFLRALLPGAEVVAGPSEGESCWRQGRPAVLDAHAFALADEGRPGRLPHRWSATSDSVAARAAVVAGAAGLVLLKSVSLPPDTDWHEAGRRGWVDETFASVLEGAGPRPLAVRAVNLRDQPP